MEQIYHKVQGKAIKGHIRRVVSIRTRVTHSSKAKVLRVGTLHVSSISTRAF